VIRPRVANATINGSKKQRNMTRLEDLQPTAAVRGILPDQAVTVVNVLWFGSEALELTYKTTSGRVANELLYRHDELRLQVVEHGRPWSFDGDGHLFLSMLLKVICSSFSTGEEAPSGSSAGRWSKYHSTSGWN
jgi:hypothetical protein